MVAIALIALSSACSSEPVVGELELTDASVSTGPGKVQIVLSERQNGVLSDGIIEGGSFVGVERLTVPDWHEPGSRLVRMEGPAWESELIGYRLYLDHRNGTDIFGKRSQELVLHEVGFDGDDYHKLDDWGADVLKVGESLGIGSVGLLSGGTVKRLGPQGEVSASVLENGPSVARVSVTSGAVPYHDQLLDVQTEYEISSGSRLTKVRVRADVPVAGWATGIVKHDSANLLTSDNDLSWSYVATFGPQSVFQDELGMAIFFPTAAAEYVGEDALNHIVGFAGELAQFEYYFSAVWGADPGRITTEAAFIAYLEQERLSLSGMPDMQKMNTDDH